MWVNELGGVTFSIGDGAEFVKVYPDQHAALLVAEAHAADGGPPTTHAGARGAVDGTGLAAHRRAAGAVGRRPALGRTTAHGGSRDRRRAAACCTTRCRSTDCPFGRRPGCPPTHRPPTGWWSATATPARPTPSIGRRRHGAAGTSISATSASPTGGPTWRSRRMSLDWNYPGPTASRRSSARRVRSRRPTTSGIAYYRARWDEQTRPSR